MSDLSPIEWAVRPLKKYAVFSGRAPRAEYWWFYLAMMVIQIPLTIVDEALASGDPFSSLFSLATFLPWLAVSVRRLHDINRSGWWVLGLFVLIVVAAAVAIGAGLGDAEGGGPAGSMLMITIVAIASAAVMAITIFVFTVMPGTDGPNDYGPDPYGPDQLEEVFA